MATALAEKDPDRTLLDDGLEQAEDPAVQRADETRLARAAWDRYEYGMARGHLDYQLRARELEGFYLGGGLQWSEEERKALQEEGRPVLEFNEVMPAINAALGYQIHNRLDIAFRPRGAGTDQDTADAISKVVMQVADRNLLHWLETEVFADGLIERRGYYDIRVNFDRSINGEIGITTLDPMDVVPDPDAKSYDPNHWADVIVTRWMSLDEIEQLYGRERRVLVEEDFHEHQGDFGDFDNSAPRNKFGQILRGAYWLWDATFRQTSAMRVRVVDWQRFELRMTTVAVYEGGDVEPVETPAQIAQAKAQGALLQRRMMKRVRWTVATAHHVLQDGISPYQSFTVVPYFPFFRRGATRGLVDNAADPQRALNKGVSQSIHILNTTANSGYMVEQNSLTNMDTEQLEEVGAKTGLVIEYRENSRPPEKIQPNAIPQGVDNLIERSMQAVRETTVPEAMRGIQSQEITGVAIQSRQFAAQQQLAVPLDNLSRTRHLLAMRILDLVQTFYTDRRVFRITDTDAAGREVQSDLVINEFDPASGSWLNDLTVGEYDVVITEQPLQVTFENSQFTQALELRKAGVRIPDAVILRHSNLTDKEEIVNQIEQTPENADPVAEAEAALKQAQAEKTKVETANIAVEAEYSAMQTAQLLSLNPLIASPADRLLRSAGFEDRDAPPIVPTMAPGTVPPVEPTLNTHPLMPANPEVGKLAGMQRVSTHTEEPR